jgi:hypothetical protein
MTLNDLKTGLGILKPGQMLSMSYAVYELVFPPGEPDELARTRAYALAEEYGCTIKNLPSEKRVLFLKPKPPTKTKSKGPVPVSHREELRNQEHFVRGII